MTAYKFATLVMLAGVALGHVVFVVSTMAEGHNRPVTVTAKQFATGDVVGHLGHPLGTVVRVTGMCIDERRTRHRADLGKTLLEIRTVNGSKLEHPFVVPIERATKDVTKPKDGDYFDYYVHEWGTFDGISRCRRTWDSKNHRWPTMDFITVHRLRYTSSTQYRHHSSLVKQSQEPEIS